MMTSTRRRLIAAMLIALAVVATACSSKRGKRESTPPVPIDANAPPSGKVGAAHGTVLWAEVFPSASEDFIDATVDADGRVALAATVKLYPGESRSFSGHQIVYAGEPPMSSVFTVFALRTRDRMEWLRIADADGGFESLSIIGSDIVVNVLGAPTGFRWMAGKEWPDAVARGAVALRIGSDATHDRVYAVPDALISTRTYVNAALRADSALRALLVSNNALLLWDGARAAWQLPLSSTHEYSELGRVAVFGDEIVACYKVAGSSFQLGTQPQIPIASPTDKYHSVVAWISADKGRVLHSLDLRPLVTTDDECVEVPVRGGVVVLEADDMKSPRWARVVSRDGKVGPRLLTLVSAGAADVLAFESDGAEQVALVEKEESGALRATVIDTAKAAVRWSEHLPAGIEFHAVSLGGDVLALTGERTDEIEFLGTRLPAPTTGDGGFVMAIQLPPR